MVLIFPSANCYCEHIHEINTNSIIKNTCAHSHVSEALLEAAPYLTARVKASRVLRVWLPFPADAVNEENDEGLL